MSILAALAATFVGALAVGLVVVMHIALAPWYQDEPKHVCVDDSCTEAHWQTYLDNQH